MLDKDTKQIIDNACDTLVGKVPSPVSQTEMITTALIYKIMDDMDLEAVELGGNKTYFTGDLEDYAFSKIIATKGHQERLSLYLTGLDKLQISKQIPEIFRRIFKEATIPFKDGQTFSLFIEEINCLSYKDSEKIGDAFEYLLDKLGSHGNAGQFRTPRHIIDFIVDIVKPSKDETILDPACGTAGFLISAYKYITNYTKDSLDYIKLAKNIVGFDIDPTMVKLSLVNLFLHKFNEPRIEEYDTISKEKYWYEKFDVILANPPFMTPKGGIIPHKRFCIKANRSEVLFVDYFMEHLNYKGRAGFVVPEGIIFNGQSAYKDLRKMMIDDGYLYTVISLPTGVFNPYSGVKTSILLFDREFARKSKDILFIHIDNDGLNLGAQRTPIDKNDLPEAIEIIEKYKNGEDISGYKRALVVSKEEILSEPNCDLSAPKYQKKEIIETKYRMTTLGQLEIDKKVEFLRGSLITKATAHPGDVPVIAGGKTPAYYNDKSNREGENITVSGSGAYAGFISYYNKPIFVSDAFTISILDENYLSLKYLYYLLKSKQNDIYNLRSGAGIPHFYIKDMRNIEIPLPPIDVQKEIVAEIENKQSAINHAQEIIRNLERERFYFDRLLEGIEYKEVKLEEVAEVISGQSPESKYYNQLSEGIPFYQGRTEFEDIYIGQPKNWTTKVTKTAVKDDILMSVRAPVGPVNICNFDNICIGRGLAAIRHKGNILNMYLFYYLKSIENKIVGNGGAVFDSITRNQINQINIPIPSLENQEIIIKQIEIQENIINTNKNLIKIMQDKINKVISSIYKV